MSINKAINLNKIRFLGTLVCLVLLAGCKKEEENSVKKTKRPVPKELKQGILQSQSAEATFEELVAMVEYDVERGHYASAAGWIEKIIRRYPESPEVPDYRYKLADCFFMGKKYLMASEAYAGFASLYPSDPREKSARFMALSAKYNHSKEMSVECDSSDTKDVIDMCRVMLGDESLADKHREVAMILGHCQDRLLNKEVAVFDSYVRRKKIEPAQRRLEKIKAEYLAQNAELEPRIAFLECKMATLEENDQKAKECLDLLMEKHSESKYTRMASGYMNAGVFGDIVYS